MAEIKREEKKVEYLELIYDLIFVYIIGRNNSLLQSTENGFVQWETFLAYILCSLAVIQIWNFSTFYINMHGRNSVRDHVALFINMYLLYYIGEGTRTHWASFQVQYHVAWALILLNIGAQYLLEKRNNRDNPAANKLCSRMAFVIIGEAALVLVSLPLFKITSLPFAALPIVFGIAMTGMMNRSEKRDLIDFPHLMERAMLYVVFTFGEMIIAIASYFEGDFTFNSVFFSSMCFLIVTGLFLCYEMMYNKIIDREMTTTGMGYMMIHIFLIFAMNCITASLEFMREEEVSLTPKVAFLTGAFLLFFICLFLLRKFAKKEYKTGLKFIIPLSVLSALFVALMFIFKENMFVNITVSAFYVFSVFAVMIINGRKSKKDKSIEKA